MSVFGQLVFSDQGRGRAVPGRLYGLPVLRAEADPLGFWGERRLRKAGRGLLRGGARRVLVPRDFRRWPLLRQLGLVPVETEGLVRANCVPLALAALASQGLSPDRATVALRGTRAGGEMARAARELCPRVRCLVVDAPSGGEELARWLRREYGVPILPPGERGHLALRFQPGARPGRRRPWTYTARSRTWRACGSPPRSWRRGTGRTCPCWPPCGRGGSWAGGR